MENLSVPEKEVKKYLDEHYVTREEFDEILKLKEEVDKTDKTEIEGQKEEEEPTEEEEPEEEEEQYVGECDGCGRKLTEEETKESSCPYCGGPDWTRLK